MCCGNSLKVILKHINCSSLVDSSDADRLERFFDSEDEDFEILSL